MIEKMWNKCSKVDVVALTVIFLLGVSGFNLLAAAVALGMAVYHTYIAYNNASK